MDTTEKKKNSPRRPLHRLIWVGLASSAICFVIYVYITQSISQCNYDTNIFVHYPTLIARCHPITHLVIGLLIIGIPVIIGLALVVFARPKIIAILLLLPACVCSLCGSYSAWTTDPSIEHISTIEFDGHIYHIAEYEWREDWDAGFVHDIILFECDMAGAICEGRCVADYANNAALRVNETTNQLQIVADEKILFTLDARQIPLSESWQKLAPVTPNNAAALQELVTLQYDYGKLVWSDDGTTLTTLGSSGIWQHQFDELEITTQKYSLPENNNSPGIIHLRNGIR